MFDAKIVQVDAEKKAIPIFKIKLLLKNPESYSIQLLGYKIEIKLAGVNIGTAFGYSSIKVDNRGSHYFEEEIQITPYLFETIDKARRNGDVHINGSINILYLNLAIEQQNQIPLVHNVYFDSYKLSQIEWINLATKLGYTRYKIFEMLWPDIPQLDELNNIIQELQDSQSLFYEGRNNEVVSKCRLILEELATIVTGKYSGNKFEMNKDIAGIVDVGSFQKQGEETKSGKIENLRQMIWRYHHIGPHYGYTVTREDAELSIMLCLSMIRYYSVQLNKLTEKSN
ncbi:hypothetical protein RE476_02885 [Methanolobus mangrovi]|uniref:Uncharacterized protein n=1 Tax=Methanolobus mangrovi TaxID=3072977 RepID=A0AA51UGL2_9EURY|nr:hypothetical protein [Methanolobus mangrovi]WMW22785.1 hypothetical protein RE476_02885 [Methanolobus mangrovi]